MEARPSTPVIVQPPVPSQCHSTEKSPPGGALAWLALAFCVTATAFGQTSPFTTIDEDTTGVLMDLATDANGRIIATGSKELNGVSTAVISASDDGGATWDDWFDGQGPAHYTVVAAGRRMVPPAFPGDLATHEDSIIVAGNMANRWIVRRSTDGGVSWPVIDEYRDEYWSAQRPHLPEILAAAVDTEGNAYIAAAAVTPVATRKGTTLQWSWLVRKIPRVGAAQTSRFADTLGTGASVPEGITCVGTTVYVAGTSGDRAQVRRSDNGGASWSLVDNYRYDESQKSIAGGIAADRNGFIYVVGAAWHAPKKGNKTQTVSWLVRKGTGVAGSFTTDPRVISASGYNVASRVAVDSGGNVHVTGQSGVLINGVQTWHWQTKRLDAGSQTWATTDGQAGGARRIAADPQGNIYWGGFSAFSGWLIRASQFAALPEAGEP